jgi:flagellar protein FlaG
MPSVISTLTAPVPSGQPFLGGSVRTTGATASAQTATTQTVQTGSLTSSPSLDAEALQKIVAEMQSKLAGTNSDLEFSVDKDSGQSVVKVTERTTKEVIWQFPSDQALQVSKELSRFLGAFVNRAV